MNEPEARKYIKNLILSSSPLRDKALERFKKRFGHAFWETKEPVPTQEPLDLVKIAEEIGLTEKQP